jgi:hypothetical protein
VEGHTYIVEWDGSETRLPDASRTCEFLARFLTVERAEVQVMIDHGPRQ